MDLEFILAQPGVFWQSNLGKCSMVQTNLSSISIAFSHTHTRRATCKEYTIHSLCIFVKMLNKLERLCGVGSERYRIFMLDKMLKTN